MPNEKEIVVTLGHADPLIVRDCAEFLMEAFNAYIKRQNRGEGFTCIDSLMAVHNFHAAVIVDLAKRNHAIGYLEAAKATFVLRMDVEKKEFNAP